MPTLSRNLQAAAALGVIVHGNPDAMAKLACIPSNVGTAQVLLITVAAGVENSTAYAVKYRAPWMADYRTISVTTDASGTQAELTALLYAAFVADPVAAGLWTITTNGSSTVTLTARQKNVTHLLEEVTDAAGDIAITEPTAAAAGTTYSFGRLVALTAATATPLHAMTCAPPTAVTGDVLSAAITTNNGAVYSQTYTLTRPDGSTTSHYVTFTGGANQGATDDAAAEAYLAAFPATIATITNAVAGTVVVTFFPGYRVTEATLEAASAGALAVTITAGTTVQTEFGVVYDDGTADPTSRSTTPITSYEPGQTVPVLRLTGNRAATICVLDPGESVTEGDLVYWETAAGSTFGRPYKTQTATRYAIPGRKAVWKAAGIAGAAGQTLAYVET